MLFRSLGGLDSNQVNQIQSLMSYRLNDLPAEGGNPYILIDYALFCDRFFLLHRADLPRICPILAR